jgi:hypothetical protein
MRRWKDNMDTKVRERESVTWNGVIWFESMEWNQLRVLLSTEMKYEKYVGQLREYQLVKDSASCICLEEYLIIQFFILTCWLNSNNSELQSQHKKIINVQKYAYA